MPTTELDAFSSALLDFLRATRRMRGRFGDEDELSLSQYHLLEPLIGDERLATCELALAAGVSAPTATRMLSGLEREGLVERVPCEADRRVVHVALTDDGRERVLAPSAARGDARRAEIFASLSAGERREAARLLERLADRRRGAAVKPTTRTLLPLAGAALAYSLAQTMVIPALPEIQHEFHAGPADATWLLTAFLLTSSIATPLLGRLGDMYGKEHWLLVSLAVFGVGSLGRALGGSLGVMIAGRAIQGAGGAIFPLAIGIIRDEFPRERVATAIGTISAMFGIGGGLGLVLAGRVRRPRLDLVDLLALAWRPRRSPRWRPGAACPSRPCACRRGSTGSAARCCRSRCWRCCSASARATPGAGPRPACSGCSPPPRSSPSLWARWELRVVDPLVDLRAHAPASGVDDEPRRVRDRLRDVRLVRADPPARADAGRGRLRLRRVGDRVGALPAARRPC